MRAEDLMVGDWVICTYPSINKPVKVIEIKTVSDEELKVVINDNGIRLVFRRTYIDPIPLTPEILEKNGFIKRYNYQWKYRDNSCTIVISIAPQIEIDGEMLGTPPINVILEGALFNINMTSDMCVHQLQHAINLCGITKEIQI